MDGGLILYWMSMFHDHSKPNNQQSQFCSVKYMSHTRNIASWQGCTGRSFQATGRGGTKNYTFCVCCGFHCGLLLRDALARGQSGLSEGFVAALLSDGSSANAFMFGIKGCENK